MRPSALSCACEYADALVIEPAVPHRIVTVVKRNLHSVLVPSICLESSIDMLVAIIVLPPFFLALK